MKCQTNRLNHAQIFNGGKFMYIKDEFFCVLKWNNVSVLQSLYHITQIW